MKGLLKGLMTTMSTASRKPVTIEYPDERHVLPVRQRSFPVLTWDFDHDEPFCTGCNVCVRNCPVDCMTAQMVDNPNYVEGTSNRRKIADKFWIDYARCMRCNICVEVCPFEAIVMDNTWEGHEHAAYDRRDLHMDIAALTDASRGGRLDNPFRPLDRIELVERTTKGEAAPEESFKGAKAAARQAQLERIARGEKPGIQEREPEKPKVAAGGAKGSAAGAGGAEVEILSESKLRAKRMRAERAAKEFLDRGEAVPAEIQADVDKYTNMKPGEAAGASTRIPTPATGEVLTGLQADGTMRFPPGVGDGPKGDPNSAEKVRARRMRAERQFKELTEKGEPIPEEMAKTLFDLGSDLAPGGTIWATLASTSSAGGGSGSAAAPLTGTNADGSMRFPPGVGDGPKGDPNSAEKVRARRMRAERQFKELTAKGEPIPEEMTKTLFDLGSDLAPGGSIWASLAGASTASAAGPSTGSATGSDDGDWKPPAGLEVGAKGDANSLSKLRARRMRAERAAQEALAKGETIPESVLATIRELGGTTPVGG